MKMFGILSLAILSTACVKGVLQQDGSNSQAASSACKPVIAKMLERYKDQFDIDDGVSIDFEDMSQEEKNCMPATSVYAASVETYLKLAEGADGGDSAARVVGSSVETYLKYAEAVGLTGGGLADNVLDPRIGIASVETWLKYAEAVSLNDTNNPNYRIGLASVETWLKGLEANAISPAKTLVSSVETYLKYWEAAGGSIGGEGHFFGRYSTETALKLAEATGMNPFDVFSIQKSLSVSGFWSQTLNTKGIVSDGANIWSKNNTILNAFGVSTANYTQEQLATVTGSFVDKGIVISELIPDDLKILSWANYDTQFEDLTTLLDKGIIVDREMYKYINTYKISNFDSVERILDKGILIDGDKDKADTIFQMLLSYQGNNFEGVDRINDKGYVMDQAAINFASGMLENGYVDSADTFLDKGYHFEVREDGIFIRSIETYLKYVEAI